MAKMITRTITSYDYEIMSVNMETREVENIHYVTSEIEMKKVFDEIMETYNGKFRPIELIHETKTTKRYGLDEEIFIKMAVELPLVQTMNDR